MNLIKLWLTIYKGEPKKQPETIEYIPLFFSHVDSFAAHVSFSYNTMILYLIHRNGWFMYLSRHDLLGQAHEVWLCISKSHLTRIMPYLVIYFYNSDHVRYHFTTLYSDKGSCRQPCDPHVGLL